MRETRREAALQLGRVVEAIVPRIAAARSPGSGAAIVIRPSAVLEQEQGLLEALQPRQGTVTRRRRLNVQSAPHVAEFGIPPSLERDK